jgi:leader peptidase (prepilin peptidase) / N-methyltransferase
VPGDPDFLSAAMLLRLLFGAVLGAVIGSFLATILVRWPEGRSAAAGRSACDGCGATLRPFELVPILSHVVQAGRCRRCGAAIDPLHVRVEIGAALIGLVAFAVQSGPEAFVTATLGWWLLLLALLDVRHF